MENQEKMLSQPDTKLELPAGKKHIPTFIGITILILVALVLFGGVFVFQYFLNKSQSKIIQPQNQTAGPALNEVEGWKTYKSNIYDYEIKYPSAYKTSVEKVYTGMSDIDIADYNNSDYSITFEIFARNSDSIMKDCLKDLSGNNITKKVEINGNNFYAFYDKKQGTGGRMELALGGIESEYHIVRNNQCYIIRYTIVPANLSSPLPSQEKTNVQFSKLDQIFSTFKFTK